MIGECRESGHDSRITTPIKDKGYAITNLDVIGNAYAVIPNSNHGVEMARAREIRQMIFLCGENQSPYFHLPSTVFLLSRL